jgi:hypothetical protein
MGPFDVFSPSAILDVARWTGPHGAARLVEASQHFPGGPVVLVLALFFAPVGPGVPAGVLLARHVPLHPAFTFGLYGLSDLLAAIACHPVFVVFRRHGRKVRPIHWLGHRVQALAMLGVRTAAPGHTAPALSRIATVGFGVDVYTAGMLATGLPVRASVGWASAIAGDLAWFALLLGTSVVAASVADDDRFVAVVMVVAMIAIPRLARRVLPALRSDRRRPAERPRPTAPAG